MTTQPHEPSDATGPSDPSGASDPSDPSDVAEHREPVDLASFQDAPFDLAVRVVTGDLPPTDHTPFANGIRIADWLDKRVVLQTEIWVDRRAHEHRVDQMTPDYRANVLSFLQHEAANWVDSAVIWELAAAIYGFTPGLEASRHLEVLDLLTPGWTDHTPLGRRLHELNQTRPHPLAPPRKRIAASESDHPEVLRDTDAGRWQVTTESGTLYLVDLDRRRILRQPADASPSVNGGHRPHPMVSELPLDHQWTDLDCLIRCRTGTPLVALDLRHETGGRGGYRVSTDVIGIRRSAASVTSAAPGDGR